MADESDNSMTRRDFLGTAALGAFSLPYLAKSLYSDNIEEYGEEKHKDYNIVILDFEGQGDSQKSIVPSKGFDLDKTIPSMLGQRLKKNGIKILSQYVLNAKLKKQNLDFDDVLADCSLAEKLGIDGCITGTYAVFRGDLNDKSSINLDYIDLKTGNVGFSYTIEDAIPFKLESMVDEITKSLMQFFNNKKSD